MAVGPAHADRPLRRSHGRHRHKSYQDMQKTLSLLLLACCAAALAHAQTRATVAVLGDSYSTFEGFIPKGNATWYSSHPNRDMTDVSSVEQTWWWQVISQGGYKMGMINSYSGATVCNTGYNDDDFSDRSFVTRSLNLGSPDIILICGGTNDSWAGVSMGEYKYEGWKRADLYYFRPAQRGRLLHTQHRAEGRHQHVCHRGVRPLRRACDTPQGHRQEERTPIGEGYEEFCLTGAQRHQEEIMPCV